MPVLERYIVPVGKVTDVFEWCSASIFRTEMEKLRYSETSVTYLLRNMALDPRRYETTPNTNTITSYLAYLFVFVVSLYVFSLDKHGRNRSVFVSPVLGM